MTASNAKRRSSSGVGVPPVEGVSVEQVARVTRAFTESGILVHAYLMYGFPTQTVQDTVDARHPRGKRRRSKS